MKTMYLLRGACFQSLVVAGVALLAFGVQRHYQQTSGDAGWWRDAKQIIADDLSADDWFGFSTAMDGSAALMGAPRADAYGPNAGAAYVFQHDRHGTRQVIKLGAEDTSAYGDFGYSVAISGKTALVGKPGDDAAGELSGAAFLYEDNGQGIWSRIARLAADDAAARDWFGVSVSLDNDIALVGTRGGRCTGTAYVFQKGDGQTWQQSAKLTSPEPESGDYFGLQVAVRDNLAVIGACGTNRNAGAAYLFQRDAAGNWYRRAKLRPHDEAAPRFFGRAVAISGRTIAVGAPGDLVDGGAVYLFQEDDAGGWPQVATLRPPRSGPFAQFGGQLAIRGRLLAVAAPWEDSTAGAVYLFEHRAGGWRQFSRLALPNPLEDDWFGASLAVSGDSLLVGAKCGKSSKSNCGAVYAFRLPRDVKTRRALRS